MSTPIHRYIQAKLQQRRDENNYRTLKLSNGLVDFYSNDYMGFARDEKLQENIELEIKKHVRPMLGSTGSRLLSGNNVYAEDLEQYLAGFHNGEAALIFNSGFDANYGLLSTLPYRGDTIIYDELVHASYHDGMRNSKATSVAFKHNDVVSLEEKLKAATGLKYVVVESVYSMDGDSAPLEEISKLCTAYEAGLIIDEAHAIGVQGSKGEGLAGNELNALARVYTYGKAMGAHGATVICSNYLKQFLVNYCRPFIYSTALPLHSLAAIKCSYEYLQQTGERREHLFALISLFRDHLNLPDGFTYTGGNSPIQSVIAPGNALVKELAAKVQQAGFDVRPILIPTVPKGKERIRICLHSFNTAAEVTKLAQTLNAL